jgi:hypothetical protein
MCGVCGTTGPLILNTPTTDAPIKSAPKPTASYIGSTNTSGGLVPQVTSATQKVVTGSAATGPRVTVVDTNNPNAAPAWISWVNGAPVDNGKPGGTYQPDSGAGRLPDLVSNVPMGALWAVGLVILLVLWKRSRS